MRLLLSISILILATNSYSQWFNWGEDGYVSRSGGGFYQNIDGSGIDLKVSGLTNDATTRQGGLKTGIDNGGAGKVIHEYLFVFSEKVDLRFSINDINGLLSENCGFVDYIGFSGDPIFTSKYKCKVVDDSLVVPDGNGSVMVEYYSIDTLKIYHGAGVKCNPGFIYISGFQINQNVQRLTSSEQSDNDPNLKNLLFDTDKSDLTESHLETLSKLVKSLNENPKLKIKISGHTDSVGESEYNQNLSEDRVQTVHQHLLNSGVPHNRIQIVFYGEENPEESNETEEGRKQNRRVEIELINS